MSRFIGCFVIALCFGIIGLIDIFPPYSFFNAGFIIMGIIGVIVFFIESKGLTNVHKLSPQNQSNKSSPNQKSLKN